MSIKTVVLSIKHGEKVVSWEGERTPATEFRALDPAFWEAPELSELFTTRKKTLDHPLLGRLARVKAEPGTVGWIGIDTDRRWVIDIQGMQGLNEWYGQVKPHLVFSVPSSLRQACESGPWAYCVPGVMSEDQPGPAPKTRDGWGAFEQDIKRLVKGSSSLDMRITAPFQRGWRWVNAETLIDPGLQNRRLGWVLRRILKTDWESHLRPQQASWEQFVESYYQVDAMAQMGWKSRDRQRQLARSLPAAEAAVRLVPKPRF